MEDESLSSDVETSLFEELEDQFIAMLEDSSSLYEESSVQFEESSSFYGSLAILRNLLLFRGIF